MSLFHRVRDAFSSTRDLANTDPHGWRLPSSYSPSKQGGKQTVIPNPKLFANTFVPREPIPGSIDTLLAYPDISHAAAHLALLECFWNLRKSASSLDVEINRPPPAYEEKAKPHTSSATAATTTESPESEKWDLLIKLAVVRFRAWWSNIGDILNHAAAYTHHAGNEVDVQLKKDQLPPLDVLLVWYVFMLDRDAYRAACNNGDVPQRVGKLCFPWPAICDAIDTENMQFTLPRTAQILFSTLSGQSADILTYLEQPPAYDADPAALSSKTDLGAEVKKHEEFIDKAHNLLWIRSPAVAGSLSRALGNYLEFQSRDASAAARALPFGVELLWRTHQLFPHMYNLFLREFVGTDKQDWNTAAETPPPGASAGSGEIATTDQERCWCWTCERIRDDIPIYAKSLSPAVKSELLSALPPEELRQIHDDLGFHEAVEGARSRGETLPTRPPTLAEKKADELEKAKQKGVGYRPGLYEYMEVLPDGRKKIRPQKNRAPYGSSGYMAL